MMSVEEGDVSQSAFPPEEVARAKIAMARAQTEVPAANFELMHRMLESRLKHVLEQEEGLRARSAALDQRCVEVEKQIGVRLTETEKYCAARIAETDRLCAERLSTSHKQAGELVTGRLAELGQIAEATHALAKPAESRPGAGEVLGDVGKVVFGRLFDVAEKAMEVNPDLARKVSKVATAVLGGGPAPAPADPGPAPSEAPPRTDAPQAPPHAAPAADAQKPYTLGDLAKAADEIPKEVLRALMQRWGISSLDDMTAAHGNELMAVYRQGAAHA